jgi:hypothetical protein
MRFHIVESVLHHKEWFNSPVEGRLELFRSAQKFYLGNVERFPGNYVEWAAFPRLPYAECMFEVERATGASIISSVVWLAERDTKVAASVFFILPGQRVAVGGNYVIDRSTGESEWSCPLHMSGASKTEQGVMQAATESALAAVGLGLRVLNCCNVKTEVIAAPAALNKKRAKSGKPALYEYRVLVLRSAEKVRLNGGGSHASPRIHLRRGHIKHRRTGDFWWEPCVVGDRRRGVVMKDYDAAGLEAAHAV